MDNHTNGNGDGFDVTPDLGGTYLKRDDTPFRGVIANAERSTFDARPGSPKSTKIVLTFAGEPVRKWSLNKTNLTIITNAFGKLTGGWNGRSIVVVWDDSVQYKGKAVGGLRVRVPQAKAPVVIAAPPEDDITFGPFDGESV
jgi:hypothetical protein